MDPVKGVSTEGFESNFQMEDFIRNGDDEGNFLYGIQFKSGDWSNPNSIPTVLVWFQNFYSLEVASEHLSIAPSNFDGLNHIKIMLCVHFRRQDGK